MPPTSTPSKWSPSAEIEASGPPPRRRAACVGFPALAEPWPDPALFPDGPDYARLACRSHREWIVNLEVSRSDGPSVSLFPGIPDERLRLLAVRLGVDGLRLVAREVLRIDRPGVFSDWPAMPLKEWE